jgi:hypothetical protein
VLIVLRTTVRLGAIPSLILVLLLWFLHHRGPFWLGTNSDPSYVYLLNALRLAEAASPAHLDHPGLTVHLFGAAMLRVAHALGARVLPLSEDVLVSPEWYLGVAVRALLVLFAAALVPLGHAVHRRTGRWGLAWIAQLGPLLSPSAAFELTDFKPEPVLYLLATLLAAALAYTPAAERRVRFAVLPGVLAGLAVVTKLTALPLLLAPLIVLDGRRARTACLASATLAATACALPALPNAGRAISFVTTLATGPGLYGVAAFAEERPYAAQWLRIVIEEAPFLTVLLFAAAVVARVRPIPRIVLALLVAGVGQLALVATHPYQPRYLVPALGLGGLLLASSVAAADAVDWGPARLLPLGLAAVLVSLTGNQVLRLGRRTTELVSASVCQQQARATAASSGCRIASYYRASSPARALYQADVFALRRYRAALLLLWPDEVFLAETGRAETFAGPVDAASLARDRCLAVQGAPGGPLHPFASAPSSFESVPVLAGTRPLFACAWERVQRADPR